MDIGIKGIITIWIPVFWPLIPPVIVYLIQHKAIKRPELYWTISLIGGYCAMLLAFAVSSLLHRYIGDTPGIINEQVGKLSLALMFSAPLGLCIYAYIASS